MCHCTGVDNPWRLVVVNVCQNRGFHHQRQASGDDGAKHSRTAGFELNCTNGGQFLSQSAGVPIDTTRYETESPATVTITGVSGYHSSNPGKINVTGCGKVLFNSVPTATSSWRPCAPVSSSSSSSPRQRTGWFNESPRRHTRPLFALPRQLGSAMLLPRRLLSVFAGMRLFSGRVA